jgi:hypothetical protein
VLGTVAGRTLIAAVLCGDAVTAMLLRPAPTTSG